MFQNIRRIGTITHNQSPILISCRHKEQWDVPSPCDLTTRPGISYQIWPPNRPFKLHAERHDPRQMTYQLPERIEKMKNAGSLQLSTAPRCYERNLPKNVRREPTLEVVDDVFVDLQPGAAITLDAAGKMANLLYNKLWERMSGRYKVVSVQSHTKTKKEGKISSSPSKTALLFHIQDIFNLSCTWTQVTNTAYKITGPIQESQKTGLLWKMQIKGQMMILPYQENTR